MPPLVIAAGIAFAATAIQTGVAAKQASKTRKAQSELADRAEKRDEESTKKAEEAGKERRISARRKITAIGQAQATRKGGGATFGNSILGGTGATGQGQTGSILGA